MDGIVLDCGAETGVIKASDGNRHTFRREDWKSTKDPVAGQNVDYVVEDGAAKEIYVMNSGGNSVLNDIVSGMGKSEKTIPTVIYVCQAAAFLVGITMVGGVIAAYVYRDGANGTWIRSHYDYQIATFWRSFVGIVIGIATLGVFGLGALILLGTYAYIIVRIIKGWRALAEGKSI